MAVQEPLPWLRSGSARLRRTRVGRQQAEVLTIEALRTGWPAGAPLEADERAGGLLLLGPRGTSSSREASEAEQWTARAKLAQERSRPRRADCYSLRLGRG